MNAVSWLSISFSKGKTLSGHVTVRKIQKGQDARCHLVQCVCTFAPTGLEVFRVYMKARKKGT